jgi:hypothetical protein
MSTTELKSEIKSEFDQLLHSLEGEEDLQDLYDTLLDFAEHRSLPRLGDTSPEYIATLQRALKQVESGQGVTTDELLQKMKQWRTE